jgi:hypothetical protein
LLTEVGDPFRFARESKFARWCRSPRRRVSSRRPRDRSYPALTNTASERINRTDPLNDGERYPANFMRQWTQGKYEREDVVHLGRYSLEEVRAELGSIVMVSVWPSPRTLMSVVMSMLRWFEASHHP